MKYQLENLVALVFASNRCYVCAVAVEDPEVQKDVSIDPERGEWIPRKRAGSAEVYTVGEARRPFGGRAIGRVIGIYDRMSTAHLDRMVHAATAACRGESYSDD